MRNESLVLLGGMVAISILAFGCPTATAPDEVSPGSAAGSTAGTNAPEPALAGQSGAVAGAAGASAQDATMQMSGRPSTGSTGLPCEVADLLHVHCQSCHGALPLSGVPMALLTWEDTQKPAVSDATKTVHELMKLRLHDTAKPMPPTGTLPADELAKLDAWLDGGAPASTDPSCKAPTPATYYGGAMPPDVEHCYDVMAHAVSAPGDQTPLMVEGEHYANFYFDAPWPDGSQGVYFETIPGQHPELFHHWLIYAEENGNQPDGTVTYPGFGSHPSAPTLVAGWAPGANNNDIPSDVGMQLSGANRKMSMEMHFVKTTPGSVVMDAGVRICTVEKNLRKNTATVSWLGTELGINIPPMAQDSIAKGVCTPQYDGDIHLLRSWPHMHMMGRKLESTLVRKDGTRELMSPEGGWTYDYNNEISYKTEYVLHPGDTVETVCHYTNTTPNAIQVGFEKRYEMCFDFVLAYPAKALLHAAGPSSSLTGSSTACEY